jgi:hypothetical protein
MLVVRRILFTVFGILLVAILCWAFINYYPFLFSKTVIGKIEKVERVELNVSLMQTTGQSIAPEMYSFAVAIKTDSGEIFTASAQDRQWAVAQEGQCAEARFYPYPIWNLEKSGTFFNARLISLRECPTN